AVAMQWLQRWRPTAVPANRRAPFRGRHGAACRARLRERDALEGEAPPTLTRWGRCAARATCWSDRALQVERRMPEARSTLSAKLSRYPRLGLAHLPTPLEPMQRLSDHLGGPRLWVKREDATGIAFGGNKLRKLDYVLHEAIAAGADT